MTKEQIEELLCDKNFSEEESEAFINMIEYAKSCQETNNEGNLKSYITEIINQILKDEN